MMHSSRDKYRNIKASDIRYRKYSLLSFPCGLMFPLLVLLSSGFVDHRTSLIRPHLDRIVSNRFVLRRSNIVYTLYIQLRFVSILSTHVVRARLIEGEIPLPQNHLLLSINHNSNRNRERLIFQDSMKNKGKSRNSQDSQKIEWRKPAE